MSKTCPSANGTLPLWAAVNTHPHQEQLAADNLRRQRFPTYCPVVWRRRSHARKVDEVRRPLFPGYLFVQVEPEKTGWRPILSTYGVRTLVRCGNQPGLVDARFIHALRAREIDGAIVRPQAPYRIGQKVRVTGGAFDGIAATVVSLDEDAPAEALS